MLYTQVIHRRRVHCEQGDEPYSGRKRCHTRRPLDDQCRSEGGVYTHPWFRHLTDSDVMELTRTSQKEQRPGSYRGSNSCCSAGYGFPSTLHVSLLPASRPVAPQRLPSATSLHTAPEGSLSKQQAPAVLALSVASTPDLAKRSNKRPYLADRRGYFAHFSPFGLAMTGAKSLVLGTCPIMKRIADEERKRASDPELFEDPDTPTWDSDLRLLFEGYKHEVWMVFVRSMVVTTLSRTFEVAARCCCSTRLLDRLTKDPRKSVMRKSARMPIHQASLAITRTVWYAALINTVSNFCWDEGCDLA
ncbi:unnamed protein product [Chrysoparadoxa australica]